MSAEISGPTGGQNVSIQIGMMGGNRDVSRFDLSGPVPATMEEMRKEQPELYQEMLLQVYETINVLISNQLKESEKSFKKYFDPDYKGYDD